MNVLNTGPVDVLNGYVMHCPPAQFVHQVQLNNVTWEVPERYKPIKLVGSGAYGQVW
jgi:hypothetical protein